MSLTCFEQDAKLRSIHLYSGPERVLQPEANETVTLQTGANQKLQCGR